jgi:hypothetical protein
MTPDVEYICRGSVRSHLVHLQNGGLAWASIRDGAKEYVSETFRALEIDGHPSRVAQLAYERAVLSAKAGHEVSEQEATDSLDARLAFARQSRGARKEIRRSKT